MKEWYLDIKNLSKKNKILFIVLMAFSIPYKLFFLFHQTTISGPDCAEYLYLSTLFKKIGIIGYIQSSDPFTFWRTPTLPFFIFISQSLTIYYIIQLILTYFLAYNFYKIFKYITKKSDFAILCFIVTLFLTYLNIAACAALTEFLQISLFIYSFRKVLYKQYDWILILALCLFCLLRAEAQFFVYFLIIREIFLRNFNKIPLYIIPLLIVTLWCVRNKQNFGSFSLVNPILSSRALIGSIYGVIYVSNEDRNEFHTKYNYFEGRDYKNQKEFINQYKTIVQKEIQNKVLNDPLDYIKIRIYQISHAFLYFGFNLERLPNDNWTYSNKKLSFQEILNTNQKWAYSNILKNKDYDKLIFRLLYNGGYAFIHLFGLIFIFINYRKLLPLIFVLLNFSFVLIVEVDMRYLITIQSISVCSFLLMCYSIIKYKSLNLNWM